VGADGLDVHAVQRLARGHEQSIAAGATETDVGACLGKADHADAIAVGRKDLHSRARAGPDVAVGVAADAIRRRWRAGAGNVELHETLAVAQLAAIDIPHLDLARHSGIGDIELSIVGRKTDPVRSAHVVGQFVYLTGFRIRAVDCLLQLLLALEAFVIPPDAVRRIGEPDTAVGMRAA